MVTIVINGQNSGISISHPSKMTDVIELIKSTIDPEHMIAEIRKNGQDLDDADWSSTLNPSDEVRLEIVTSTPEQFVNARFSQASDAVNSCFIDFRDARKSFQGGDVVSGNQSIIKAVNTAKAFFEWYATMYQLLPEASRPRYDINNQVGEISEICKRICQQQLYQSWWALGETIEKELEPRLDKLETFCRGIKPS